MWDPLQNIYKEIRDGRLLCKLVQRLVPKARLNGVNQRPRSRAPAISNIEKALAVIWKNRVSSGRIPSADEIYKGKKGRVNWLLNELFEAFGVRRAEQRAAQVLHWVDSIAQLFGECLSVAQNLQPRVKGKRRGPSIVGLAADLQDGLLLGYIAKYYAGNSNSLVDLGQLWHDPIDDDAALANVHTALNYLRTIGCTSVFMRPEDIMAGSHDSQCLVQLHALYAALHRRKCELAPAAGPRSLGLTEVNGRRVVTGVLFREHTPRAVMDTSYGSAGAARRSSLAQPPRRSPEISHAPEQAHAAAEAHQRRRFGSLAQALNAPQSGESRAPPTSQDALPRQAGGAGGAAGAAGAGAPMTTEEVQAMMQQQTVRGAVILCDF